MGAFAVGHHATGCSLRETQAILRSLGVEPSHQAIWHWYIAWLTASQTRRRPRERRSRAASWSAKRSNGRRTEDSLDSRTLCVLRTAQPSRVAVDEPAVRITGIRSWEYAAIDLDTNLILDVVLFGRRDTDPAAAFLHGLTEKHDLSDAEFLVDGAGYLTALSRVGLSGYLTYVDRSHIEKWFHTLKIRIGRFHNSWVGSRASGREWLEQFVHDYNTQRPN
ncbi:integrase [Natrialba aegyptia DSM 13077]|uniref:Integrase n=1 Tax=Natrialba aegyptia DSM 13077 TaxID=1227491 RepID=M0AV48_9EURY|nr:integrase [Natrialba aegyptia DSM 13077]